MAMLQPSAAKVWARTAPRPLLPPVIKTFRPLRSYGILDASTLLCSSTAKPQGWACKDGKEALSEVKCQQWTSRSCRRATRGQGAAYHRGLERPPWSQAERGQRDTGCLSCWQSQIGPDQRKPLRTQSGVAEMARLWVGVSEAVGGGCGEEWDDVGGTDDLTPPVGSRTRDRQGLAALPRAGLVRVANSGSTARLHMHMPRFSTRDIGRLCIPFLAVVPSRFLLPGCRLGDSIARQRAMPTTERQLRTGTDRQPRWKWLIYPREKHRV